MEENKRTEEQIQLTFKETGEEETNPVIEQELEGADSQTESNSDNAQPTPEKEPAETSIEQLKKFTEEDEDLYSATKTLRSILGGDFLTADLVRKQILLVVLIFICFFLHISFRYMNQKELVEIDRLKQQLEDSRFNALTRFSELTAKSRQSYIEQFLKQNNDSTLQTSTNPPYIIHLHGDEGDFSSPDEDVKDTTKTVQEEPEVDDAIEE